MSASTSFTFTYDAAELKEGTRAANRLLYRIGRLRLYRTIEVLALAAAGLLTASLAGPEILGLQSFDEQLMLFLIAFLLTALGMITERICVSAMVKRMTRDRRRYWFAERVVTVASDGIRMRVGDVERWSGWPELVSVKQGKTLLIFQMRAGDWFGIPLRLAHTDTIVPALAEWGINTG